MSDEVIGGPCKTCGQQGFFNCCGEETKQPDQVSGFALTEDELKLCPQLTDVLDALADFHDSKASMAAAMGYQDSTDHHAARADELRNEARRIESTW